MTILQEHAGRYLITVPKGTVKAMGWKKGDVINFTRLGDFTEPKTGDVVMRSNGYNVSKVL